jgi:hypothetical protein
MGFPLTEGDTACILTGEGTLCVGAEVESKNSEERIISNPRVPVIAPDGEALMCMKASRARRWIKEGKAKAIRTKLGIFAVQLIEEPSGREKQPIVVGIDPGSKYTGVAVASKMHLEQPSKGGIRREYGGTTTPFVFRKGDYVEATQGRRTVRGWVSGCMKNLISVSDFDWKRLGQFVVSKVRLLERNSGLLLRRKEVKRGEVLPRLKPWVSFA